MNMEKTGAYLASLRKGRDMTQQQVADTLGVSNKTVSKWESGAGLPDIGALPALAALYGVTADDILAGETRPRACGDTPSEVGLYLERRSGLRFRIGYSVAVMLLAAVLAIGGAALKEPLVRDRKLRFAVYGSCALMALVEIVYLAVCWQPALLYAGTGVTQFGGESTLTERYQALSAAAEPMAAVRWIALGLALAVCVYHALRARQRKPEN